MTNLWPHQERGVQAVLEAHQNGRNRVVLTSPTGGGKTRMACELIETWLWCGDRVAVYTRRRILTEQISKVLQKHGIDFGVRAAGGRADWMAPVQVCSMQTEDARVLKKDLELFDADRVIIDECHDCTAPVARKIIDRHVQDGAKIVGLSATPLGLAGLYDVLIQAGTNSELRACGALVPAYHYAPDEPDMKAHKSLQAGHLPTEPENRKIMRPEVLFGSVIANLRKINPELKPTILFASGVAESLWFAEELTKAGIPSAHVDGDSVWLEGKFYKADRKAREAVLNGNRDSEVRVVCNRFVLREGVDAPWLAHGVLATIFGHLQSYLQSGGRLLRAHPGLDQVTVQDHGGNWWRHGSLNADRTWRLEWTADIERGLREDAQRSGGVDQPGRCPQCGLIIMSPRCRLCGWSSPAWRRSRAVMQTDGTLREQFGDVWLPRRVSQKPDGPKLWEQMYWRSRTEKGQRTFRAAMALFAQENDWGWPSRDWPFMPRNDEDFFRLCSEVPMENLNPKEVAT